MVLETILHQTESEATSLKTGHHLRTIQTIFENVYVWLVWPLLPVSERIFLLTYLVVNKVIYNTTLVTVMGKSQIKSHCQISNDSVNRFKSFSQI